MSNHSCTRRRILTGGLAAGGSLAVAPGVWADGLLRTPRQTSGPFYTTRLPLDTDNDLVSVSSRGREAEGGVIHLFGRVLDISGGALPGAQVEIWQCDAAGFYHHWRDRGGRADPNFQGYGQMPVQADGGFRFRTIKPVAYPGRAPHIHFRITGGGIDGLTTQMYVAGDPRNDGDFVLNTVTDERARSSLIVELKPAPELEQDSLAGLFDIVLGDHTVFGQG